METNKYPNMFSPIMINKMMVKNRLISAPIEYYWERSNDGYGIMVRGTGGSVIGPRSRGGSTKGPLETGAGILKYKNEIAEMKEHGAKASVELCWGGSRAWAPKGDFVYGPDEGVKPDGTRIKRMDEKDMEDVCKQWATSARLCKEVGFDMIMLHWAHGWGPSEFLSPHYNHRDDEYGGSIENRCRFPLMVLKAVREAVGKDYPIDIRISAQDDWNDGYDINDLIYFAKQGEKYLDMINLSYGDHGKHWTTTISTPYKPHCVNLKYAAELKKHISIPVSVVGAFMTPEEVEEAIASGKTDMVVLARAGIADPQWITKAWQGRSEDIIPCIRCMECREPSCSVNPRVYIGDRQIVDYYKPAEIKKNVVVIGGGVAGINAALVASKRGHHVTLFEATDSLGGQLKCADYEKIKIDLKRYKDYLIRQINKSNVDVRLNTRATADMVAALNPQAVIIAIGAEPVKIPVKGVDNKKVIQAVDVYPDMESTGKNVVIIGGGQVGCELACDLHDIGRNVTIVEMKERICDSGIYHPFEDYRKTMSKTRGGQVGKFAMTPSDSVGNVEKGLREELNARTITELPSSRVIEINDEGVVIERNNETITVQADTVVLAAGFRSKQLEAAGFYGICQDTCTIGDVDQVANVGRAVSRAVTIAGNI